MVRCHWDDKLLSDAMRTITKASLSHYHRAVGLHINTLRPGQNGRRFADDTFKRIFLNENVKISIKISLKFVPKGPINNNPALVQIMAWRRPGGKPLSEPMMVSLLTHICVTRPQWVKAWWRIFAWLKLGHHSDIILSPVRTKALSEPMLTYCQARLGWC